MTLLLINSTFTLLTELFTLPLSSTLSPLSSPLYVYITCRTRMAKMESQLASLTAWVQTALSHSRPGSSASDGLSDSSFPPHSNRSSEFC